MVADRSDQTITFREFPTGPLYGHSGLLNTRSASEWQDLLAAHPTAATLYRDHEVQTDTLAHILADHDVVPPLDYFVRPIVVVVVVIAIVLKNIIMLGAPAALSKCGTDLLSDPIVPS